MNCIKVVLIAGLMLVCATVNAEDKQKKKDILKPTSPWALTTDLVGWLDFGTANLGLQLAVSRHAILHIDAYYNPWTFNSGGTTKIRQQGLSADFGFKWFFWNAYCGWWLGGKAQYDLYNKGGIFHKDRYEQGQAFGGGIGFGYSLMLAKHLNMDFSLYGVGGAKTYTQYSTEHQGLILSEGTKGYVLPEAHVSLIYIF